MMMICTVNHRLCCHFHRRRRRRHRRITFLSEVLKWNDESILRPLSQRVFSFHFNFCRAFLAPRRSFTLFSLIHPERTHASCWFSSVIFIKILFDNCKIPWFSPRLYLPQATRAAARRFLRNFNAFYIAYFSQLFTCYFIWIAIIIRNKTFECDVLPLFVHRRTI